MDTTQQPKETEDNTTNMTPKAKNTDNEWTQVTWRRRKRGEDPLKAPGKPNTPAPKEIAPTSSLVTKNKNSPSFSPVTQKTPSTATQEIPPAAAPRKVTFPIKGHPNPQETPMDTTQKIKRRRDCGEGQTKKLCASRTKTSPKPEPQQQLQQE